MSDNKKPNLGLDEAQEGLLAIVSENKFAAIGAGLLASIGAAIGGAIGSTAGGAIGGFVGHKLDHRHSSPIIEEASMIVDTKGEP